MQKNTKMICLIFAMIFSAVSAYSQTPTLHPFYEQNGDCYILVGEGNARAVWALNNLRSGVLAAQLYDPNDAYGLTAAQKWNPALLRSEKDLFTFAGTESALTSLAGQLAPRRIVMNATTNVYGFNEVPPSTVHRFHGAPNASPTGRGNHPTGTINALFGGIDYPCNRVPDAVATMPGFFWYPMGQGFYHAADVVVWSNWTYGTAAANRRTTANPPPVSEQYNQRTDGSPPTRGPWASCCAGNRPGNGWIRGGWVRRMIRENLWGAYRNLKLFKYRIDSGAGSPSFDRDVANVLARITGTMDMNGECCDGCIARIDGAAMPGVPSPFLSCIYSTIVDRAYIYRRDQNATAFTLMGSTVSDQVVGNGGDLTCKFLGISSKSENGNFVYLLGLNQINQWLTAANAHPSMQLNELTDVAVSDQWWQTGGIIYAYDASKGYVYCFVRNESGTNGIPSEINVNIGGILPDKIGSDGFGSLYMLRTEYDPVNTSMFVDGTEYQRIPNGTMAGGIPLFRARFRQDVYKSVYRRDYYTGNIERLNNMVKLGTNYFIRDYITADDQINSPKIWMGGLIQLAPIIDANIRTELAVINSPSPPRPSHLDAVTDCVGPMVSATSGFQNAVPDENGDLTDDRDYWFMVENAPYFDANDVNIGNVGEDLNSNGRIGQFPNTIQTSSIKYYWKVIQTHDRFGEPVPAGQPPILDMEADGVSGDYLFLFPPGAGKFRIGVKVAYRYYDYRDLPVGALSSRKGDVLKPPAGAELLVAEGEDAAGYSWSNISIKQVPPIISPEDRGVIMSGIYRSNRPSDGLLSNFRPGPAVAGFGCNNAGYGKEVCGHAFCDYRETTVPATTIILDGHSIVPNNSTQNGDGTWQINYAAPPAYWALRLRESNHNLRSGINRIASMTSEDPPNPNDPALIPGTLQWVGGLSVTWTSELKRGAEIIIDKQLNTTQVELSLSQLRQLLPVPSEPLAYTVTVDFRRTYRYEIYQEVWRRVGGVLERTIRPVPRVVNMRILSDSQVVVTDNTPPAKAYVSPFADTSNAANNPNSQAFFVNKDMLYGTTGETLLETESPPSPNPSQLVFVVADNNPMGNSTVSNPITDAFHATVPGVGPRLRVNHNRANQLATFSFDTFFGVMPPEGDPAGMTAEQLSQRIRYSSGAGGASRLVATNINNAAEFDSITGTIGQYNRSFSYRAYTINLSDLQHFSRDLAKDAGNQWTESGAWSGRMHHQIASNQGGYRNLQFGLAWREACHSSVNNLSVATQKIGQIVVRDNDRPNAFITAVQDKYLNSTFHVPTNIDTGTGALPPRWVRFAIPGMGDAMFNGPQGWDRDDNSSAFFADFRVAGASPVTNVLFPAGNELEVDVPVRFDALVADNAGTVATMTFRLLNAADDVLVDASFDGNLPMQFAFREPGRYKVILQVRDDAFGWPSDPYAYSPEAPPGADPGASPRHNLRNVEAVFDVVPTRLDYRVIERNRTGSN